MNRKIIVIIELIFGIIACNKQPRIECSDNADKNVEYLVTLMGGQSNMVGKGKVSDLKSVKFENINYFNFGMT